MRWLLLSEANPTTADCTPHHDWLMAALLQRPVGQKKS